MKLLYILRRGASYLSTARARDRHRGEAIKTTRRARESAAPALFGRCRARVESRPDPRVVDAAVRATTTRASTRDGVERARAVGGRGERDDADDGGRDVDDV
jgi:hypothetical protein